MKFSLLLLTDCPSPDYGLLEGQSFGEQLGRRLQQQGYDLTSHRHQIPPVDELTDWLRQQPLAEYDLIVIQPRLVDLLGPNPKPTWINWDRNWSRTSPMAMQMLVPLRAHRHRTLLLTPFLHQCRVQNRLIDRAIARLIELGEQTGLTVFDTGRLLGVGDEYFLPHDPARLNAVSHELIGSWLYDFYEQQPKPMSAKGGSHRSRPIE